GRHPHIHYLVSHYSSASSSAASAVICSSSDSSTSIVSGSISSPIPSSCSICEISFFDIQNISFVLKSNRLDFDTVKLKSNHPQTVTSTLLLSIFYSAYRLPS